MTDYTKITNYAAKDLLLHLDPAKAIKGTEVGAEFDSIATMSATKTDKTTLAASGGAALVGYLPAGTGAVATTVQSKLRESISVFDFMTAAQITAVQTNTWTGGVTDVTTVLQSIFTNLSTLTGGAVRFPTGTYRITAALRLGTGTSSITCSNVYLFGGPGVVIYNTFGGGGGYPGDGFIIGNPTAANGGAGTAINISNVYVDGFEFQNTRLGVWVTYGKEVEVINIRSSGAGVVASGNDADCNCESITFRNITRTAANAGTFYTLGMYSTVGFRVENVTSHYAVSGWACTWKTCQYGTISGLDIDQVTNVNGGIEIMDSSQFITISDFNIRNAATGIVNYDANAGTRDKVSIIGNGIIKGCTTAIGAFGGGTTFHDIQTYNNSVSLSLTADSSINTFNNCNFREGVILDPADTKYAQRFINCLGFTSKTSFYVATNTTVTNATGDGTIYTVPFDIVNYDTGAAIVSAVGAVTTPIASPGVVNWNSHGLTANQPFIPTGTWPTGVTPGNTYYILAAGLTANAFEMSSTVGGAAINFTVSAGANQVVTTKNYLPNTGAFIAPFTGSYLFTASVGISAGAGWTYGYMYITTPTYTANEKILVATNGTGLQQLYGSSIIRLTATQPAYLKIVLSGGTKNVSIGPYVGQMSFTGEFLGQL